MSLRPIGDAIPYAYRRGPPRGKRQNDNPEHRLQVQVAEYLRFAMPKGWLWSANPAGMRASVQQGVKAKSGGLHAGWPDLMFLSPRGGTRYIELKSETGSLSEPQRAFRDHCQASGQDMWALCRTVEEVEAVLLRWKVPVVCPLSKANRYAGGM